MRLLLIQARIQQLHIVVGGGSTIFAYTRSSFVVVGSQFRNHVLAAALIELSTAVKNYVIDGMWFSPYLANTCGIIMSKFLHHVSAFTNKF